MLFSRAWVKVMSLIKEIDEILTCSNIDYYGHNDDHDNFNTPLDVRFDDDACDYQCML